MSIGERPCVDSHWRIVWPNTWPVINLTVVSACKIQDPSHSVCRQRAYNKASDAGNRCHLCEPAGYLSHIHLEENERGFIQPFPHVIHWDNPFRATTSWRSIWVVYSKDCGTTSTPSNPETSSPEDYFRITLFDEFLMLFLSLRIGLSTIQLIPLLSPKCVCTTFSDAVYRV